MQKLLSLTEPNTGAGSVRSNIIIDVLRQCHCELQSACNSLGDLLIVDRLLPDDCHSYSSEVHSTEGTPPGKRLTSIFLSGATSKVKCKF